LPFPLIRRGQRGTMGSLYLIYPFDILNNG